MWRDKNIRFLLQAFGEHECLSVINPRAVHSLNGTFFFFFLMANKRPDCVTADWLHVSNNGGDGDARGHEDSSPQSGGAAAETVPPSGS